MRFSTPIEDVTFEIPDSWWEFSSMDDFCWKSANLYLYSDFEFGTLTVPIDQIEPPKRSVTAK